MHRKLLPFLSCCLLIAMITGGDITTVQANKNNKDSAAKKMIKKLQDEVKVYEQKLKQAQARMKEINAEGEKVQPLIEPAEKAVRNFKEAMESEQRKRIAASREMNEKIESDPKIGEVRAALEKAERKRDEVMAKLLPKIRSAEMYQKLEEKRDAAQQYLDKVKREQNKPALPYAATEFAKHEGALATYVQDQLKDIPEYKAAAAAAAEAQAHRLETERGIAERCRAESGLDSIDEKYESNRDAYRDSREKLRDLEIKFKKLQSDYKDAEKDADWAAQRITLREKRIKILQRKK